VKRGGGSGDAGVEEWGIWHILSINEHFIIIIIIIKNEKIRVTLCENAAGALYIFNNKCFNMAYYMFINIRGLMLLQGVGGSNRNGY